MSHRLAALALAPLLLAQGRLVRRRILRLPEPEGERSGMAGEGSRLRLLVAGDSAAAGVGVSRQADALSGRLVQALAPTFRVEWRLEAKTGASTAGTIRWLSKLGGGPFDVLVTSLGVNDVTGGVRVRDWLVQQAELRELVRERLGVKLLIISSLPPVGGFPALPQPLRWILGRRARDFSAALRESLEEEADAHLLDLDFTLDPSLMAEDGFHPGPVIYRGWAERAAGIIHRAWSEDRSL